MVSQTTQACGPGEGSSLLVCTGTLQTDTFLPQEGHLPCQGRIALSPPAAVGTYVAGSWQAPVLLCL